MADPLTSHPVTEPQARIIAAVREYGRLLDEEADAVAKYRAFRAAVELVLAHPDATVYLLSIWYQDDAEQPHAAVPKEPRAERTKEQPHSRGDQYASGGGHMKTATAGTRLMDLWVDDSKPAPHGVAVARTYDDAVRMLRRFDYGTLYLDHDLGDDAGRTGYDLLMAMAAEGRVPETVVCISWNPVGRKRIEDALLSFTPAEGARE